MGLSVTLLNEDTAFLGSVILLVGGGGGGNEEDKHLECGSLTLVSDVPRGPG